MADEDFRLQLEDPNKPKSVRRAVLGANKLPIAGGVPEPVADAPPPGVRTAAPTSSIEPQPTQMGGTPGKAPLPLAQGDSNFRTAGGVNEPKIPIPEVTELQGFPKDAPMRPGMNQANPTSNAPMGPARGYGPAHTLSFSPDQVDFSNKGPYAQPQPIGQAAEGVRTAATGGAGAPPGGSPPPPGGPSQRGGIPYEIGKIAGQDVKALHRIGGELLPGAAGYIGAKILNSTDAAKTPPVSPPGAGPASSPNVAQIPVSAPGTGGAPPTQVEQQPMGVGGNTEFTRNLANTMNAVAPFAGGAVSGMRGAGAAQQLMSAGYGAMAARPEGGDPTGMARPAPQVQQTATTQPQTDVQRGGGDVTSTPTGIQPGATPDNKNQVIRHGNSFEGNNITSGFTYGGDGKPGGAGSYATSVGGGDYIRGGGGGGDQRSIAEIQRGIDAYGPGNGAVLGYGQRDRAAERNEQVDRSNQLDNLDRAARMGATSHERSAARAAYAEMAGRNNTLTSGERVAGVREAGETTRANAQNQAALAQHRMANATTIRGQDIGLEGHRMQMEMQRSVAQRQIAHEQRQYQMTADQHGVAQANVERGAREDAQKHLESYATSNAPVTGDTEKDAQIKANFVTGLNAAWVAQKQEAESRLEKDPNNKQLASQVEAMRRLGPGAMNEVARRKAIKGIEFNEFARANRGFGGMYGSSPVNSSIPATDIHRDKDTGDLVANNGARIPAYLADRDGAFFSIGGIPSERFKELIEK